MLFSIIVSPNTNKGNTTTILLVQMVNAGPSTAALGESLLGYFFKCPLWENRLWTVHFKSTNVNLNLRMDQPNYFFFLRIFLMLQNINHLPSYLTTGQKIENKAKPVFNNTSLGKLDGRGWWLTMVDNSTLNGYAKMHCKMLNSCYSIKASSI